MRDFNFTIVSKISQKYVKPCIKCKKKDEWGGDRKMRRIKSLDIKLLVLSGMVTPI
jgi:hypothetical protein